MLISKDLSLIWHLVEKAKARYPNLFDHNLDKSFFQLLVNQNENFFKNRNKDHIAKILLVQFLLQKKFEQASLKNSQRLVFSRIFKTSDRICMASILSFDRKSEIFNETDLFKILKNKIAGVIELQDSFYTFQSIEFAYLFCYLEIQKVRGCELSILETKKLQKEIEKQIAYGIKEFCPAVFCPFNFEDSFRQLNALGKELNGEDDLPQLSVSFKGQTTNSLEYIFHLVYPKKKGLLANLTKMIPDFLLFNLHTTFTDERSQSDSIVFSLYYPIDKITKPINLLSVRKSLTVLLEEIIGPYRDFNGGLFVKQADVFEKLKLKLSHIKDFNFFASKLFYSLKPIEIQLTLSFEQAKLLFKSFSKAMQSEKELTYLLDKQVLIVKSTDEKTIKHLIVKIKDIDVYYSSLEINNAFYLAIIDPNERHLVSNSR